MQNFVNREAELQLIEQQITILIEKHNPIPLPIIEFYGVGGIGKTTILRKIEQNCQNWQLPAIWIDASQKMSDFSRGIVAQVQRYNVQFRTEDNDWLNQSIIATRALLTKGPVVFLIDSLDAADEERRNQIEHILVDLIKDDKLFTILASKRMVAFENSIPIARRLTPTSLVQLQSFNEDSYTTFINGLEHKIEPEISDIIFEWTHGYPLAVNVMVQAIRKHRLDPHSENGKRQLLSIVVEEVISRGILANVAQTADDLAWYQTMLNLLSIPRCFNLITMQKVIENFAPHYKLGSSFAYRTLQERINQNTDVLQWERPKAGFSVKPPIRHIFQTRLKIEEYDMYKTIHNFLAGECRRLADEVSGTDRIRYLQEYLYHSAHCEDSNVFQQRIEKTIQYIIAEPSDYPLQFHDNFKQDEELHISLSIYGNIFLSNIYKHLSLTYKQKASEIAKQEEHIRYLHAFLYYTILDPIEPNIVDLLKANIQPIVTEETSETCSKLCKKLLKDTNITKKLGAANISVLSDLLPS